MTDGPALSKTEILLALDSAIGSIMSTRMLIDKLMPDDAKIELAEDAACPHVHRAPSDQTFCLDCEQTVPGVSSGFAE